MDAARARQDLERIFRAGLGRVDPYRMIKDRLFLQGSSLVVRTEQDAVIFDLSRYDRIIVLGTGKATAKMALAVEELLGDRITDGLISVKAGHTEPLGRIRIIEAGHPVPDERSIRAARETAALAEKGDASTLFINLVSGGGSALLSYPLDVSVSAAGAALTLGEKQAVTKVLLACGATIQEINCIRKHISGLKGGRLARLMYPADSLNLILSDVVGDRLDSIASGLTTWDRTTYADAESIVRKYGIDDRIPENVKHLLRAGVRGEIPETPKEGDPAFGKVHNILIGTNYAALLAAQDEARALGYDTIVLSSQVTGEAREIAKFYLAVAREALRFDAPVKRPGCIIAGGETTVTLAGDGMGGRNQEMALSFLAELASGPGEEQIAFLSAATDGNDGPTDAAGAFADVGVLALASRFGLDIQEYLSRNDSYRFFDRIGMLLKTGPTNTNVCDLQLVLVW